MDKVRKPNISVSKDKFAYKVYYYTKGVTKHIGTLEPQMAIFRCLEATDEAFSTQ
jgi:hypothetical protein